MQIWLVTEVWCGIIDLPSRMIVYSGVQERMDRDEKVIAF